jgi:hypothetical protein
MADSGAVLDALHRIGDRASDDMSERDVENLFLKTDRRQVEETDIEALEAEIDEAVYDLFDLTKRGA